MFVHVFTVPTEVSETSWKQNIKMNFVEQQQKKSENETEKSWIYFASFVKVRYRL